MKSNKSIRRTAATPVSNRRTGPAGALLAWAVLAGTVLAGAILGAGCGAAERGQDGLPEAWLAVDLDKSSPERLLRYYLGAYAAPEGGDPFAAGLVVQRDGRYYVDRAALAQHFPAAPLDDADADGRLSWDELAEFVQATYYQARGVPATRDAFRAETPYTDTSDAWFSVDLHGVMTTARRRIYVRTEAIRAALRAYQDNGNTLIYPIGTTFVGEHRVDDAVAETTWMRKRADGFWDYVTYGPDGQLAPQTATPPRALDVPTQCVGCHFGAKLFEPERSFPAPAPDGPHGPRGLYVDAAWRDADVVAFFDEHSKRSDHVLGLYGTLFVSRLRAERTAGRLAGADAALLDALQL